MKVFDYYGRGIGDPLSGPQWVIVRFPDGSWSSGGSLADWNRDSPDCEAYVVHAGNRSSAKKKAQRYRSRKKARVESAEHNHEQVASVYARGNGSGFPNQNPCP